MRIYIFWLFLLLTTSLFSQRNTISGYVRDAQTDEIIIGAVIYHPATKTSASSNGFGFYSLSVPLSDSLIMVCGYVGYTNDTVKLQAKGNSIKHTFKLSSNAFLKEVVISEARTVHDENKISTVELSVEEIKKIPALMGETDVLRAYQLMPGVQSGKEGTSGLYVRGGSPDQNLFLMDDMPLYYVNHIGGFVSVFDVNSINDITLYKAGFPARYGGRLSSVMDIRLKDGNNQKVKRNYTFGILSSKLSFEGPLKKDKTTFLISGRRSLFDLFTRALTRLQTSGKFGGGYAFYDLTGKVAHKINDNNKLYFSVYGGGDNIFLRSTDKAEDLSGKTYKYRYRANIKWGNFLSTLRWNHIFSPKLFSNTTIGYTRFFYTNKLFAQETDIAASKVTRTYNTSFRSGISDITAKSDYFFYPDSKHSIRLGAEVTSHFFNPGITVEKFENKSLPDSSNIAGSSDKKLAHEGKLYIEDEYKINSNMSVNAGIHGNIYAIENSYFISAQPRILFNYTPFEKFSVKAAYSNMQQNLHLLSNSGAGLPTDLWVPATQKAMPEKSDQFVIGINKTLSEKSGIELSVESYYKTLSRLIELKEGESFFSTNTTWENKIEINGTGEIYGIEFLLQKKQGRFTGWAGYTLSKNIRRFENLNQGNPFPYRYDRRHDISIVANYDVNEHFSLSATWMYSTGQALTLSVMDYGVISDFDGYNGISSGYTFNEIHVYTERNGYRMPSYHRLDAGLNYKKQKRKGESIWSLSIYNLYNRQNPYFLYFEKNGNKRELYQLSLFPIIPSFSYSYVF